MAINNWSLIKKKNKDSQVLRIIKNQYEILAIKKQKLKLGKIVFDIKELIYAEIPLMETLEIRYSRQDNTESDNLKLETRLNALKWKWDFYNIAAFFIVFLLFLCLLDYWVHCWMVQNLPAFVLRENRYEELLTFTFTSLKASFNLSFFPSSVKYLNNILFNNLAEYCIKFNIFF